jgi:hypothetical protein
MPREIPMHRSAIAASAKSTALLELAINRQVAQCDGLVAGLLESRLAVTCIA